MTDLEWASLARPEAYPEDPSARFGLEPIQTHISRVFLTRERVYKFRKPVDLGFVRFRSRPERNADCLREVALNRRLAPDVYLGVAPLLGEESTVRVGPIAEMLFVEPGRAIAEHCVVMRRLRSGCDALTLLSKGQLGPEQIERSAERIARFHAKNGLGTPSPFTPDAWRDACIDPAEDNLRVLAEEILDVSGSALLGRVREHTRQRASRCLERFEQRRRAGRAVDGHGDLHLEHVWFEGEDRDPRIIDCLEFSDALRRIDPACDVAFLAMDLHYRGARVLAERLLRRYARETDDFDLYSVVDFFASYRAGVRAKVAALAAHDPAIERGQALRAAGSMQRHLELAERLLEPRFGGRLVLVGGVVGAGKSSVAEALADLHGAVVISSDRVRKRLLGVSPTTRLTAGWLEGAYSQEQSERVYAALLERAAPVLESGRMAILDASFSRQTTRDRARQWALERKLPSFFVEARCSRQCVLERLEQRAATGLDPSDAGPELYDESVAAFETLEEWPSESRAEIQTDSTIWCERLGGIELPARPARGSRV